MYGYKVYKDRYNGGWRYKVIRPDGGRYGWYGFATRREAECAAFDALLAAIG